MANNSYCTVGIAYNSKFGGQHSIFQNNMNVFSIIFLILVTFVFPSLLFFTFISIIIAVRLKNDFFLCAEEWRKKISSLCVCDYFSFI